MKYSFKKVKGSKGKEGYQYTGTLKDGTTFTSKKYSTEQSARADVDRQRNAHRVSSAKNQPVTKHTPAQRSRKTKSASTKKKAVGGRSPMMDKMVSKYGPSMRKAGSSQYNIATMAKNVVEGGDVESWRKRYKTAVKPTPTPETKPKPKKQAVGYEKTSTWSGKASDVRNPKVKRKTLYGDWLGD